MKLLLMLIVATMLMPQLTQARVIKIYTYNGAHSRQLAERPCLGSRPIGCVSFKTDSTWIIVSGDSIRQEWSDVVMATGCKKDSYLGYITAQGGDIADCRQNEGYGDLFSWVMVSDYQDKLCPNGWRVPTAEDFKALNMALGGQDVMLGSYYSSVAIRDSFLTRWGGTYGGRCGMSGELEYQGLRGIYWSLSEIGSPNDRWGNFLSFYSDGAIYPYDWASMFAGMMLRCVK